MGSFVFPYAIANQAVTAMEDLAAQLRAAVDKHSDALTIAHEDFEGETRDQFDRDVATGLDMLSMFARFLDGEADALRATIVYAHVVEVRQASTP
ncbi:MAG: hypothetical protein QOC92_3981 [Acidimicrobiaceae bacterium]